MPGLWRLPAARSKTGSGPASDIRSRMNNYFTIQSAFGAAAQMRGGSFTWQASPVLMNIYADCTISYNGNSRMPNGGAGIVEPTIKWQ